jgi:hypothetical protein
MNLNVPKYWRNQAKEARAAAVQMTDARPKTVMLGIAQNHENLAAWTEQRASEPFLKT